MIGFAVATLGRALHADRWLLVLVAVHLGAAILLAPLIGTAPQPLRALVAALGQALAVLVPLCLIVLAVGRLVWMALRVRTDRPIVWFLRDLAAILGDARRMVGGTLALLAILVFTGTFVHFKAAIPAITPYSWDPALAALDRALHLGTDPWRILAPLLGAPLVTSVVAQAYLLWAGVMFLVMLVACFDSGHPRLRATFLIGSVLKWAIGGNLIALAFASGGPVYYEALGHGRDFVPLTEGLRALDAQSPVSALEVQRLLWEGYLGLRPAAGISAFPSMHVSGTVMAMLYCFGRARWAGWLMAGFLAVIMAGSVHLGWHYAIDGYAGALIAVLAWALAGRLAGRGKAGSTTAACDDYLPKTGPSARAE